MTRRDTLILRAAAVWTLWIWGTRVWNIVGDDERSTGFKVVHVVLALVSVTFAVLIWTVASRNQRRTRMEESDGQVRADHRVLDDPAR